MHSGRKSCTLITRWDENGRKRSVTRTFQQDRITIGRGSKNIYVLEGASKESVSRIHAEIYEKQGVWNLCDRESLNGTKLNGIKLTPKQEYPLHDGDRFVIGMFQLEFRSGPSAETIDLSRLARSAAGKSVEEAAVDTASHVPGTTSCTAEESQAQSTSKPEPASAYKEPQRQNSGNGLEDQRQEGLAQANTSGLNPSNDLPQETNYTHKLLEAVSLGLAKAIGGRREFQRIYGTRRTQSLAGKLNLIKEAENAKEIEAILLNPTSCHLTEREVVNCVKEVFEDIIVHQVGLIAALDGSARGVLKQFDPAKIHAEISDDLDGKGIARFSNRKDQENAKAWQRYVRKYRQVINEGVDIREDIVGRQIAESYSSACESRKRS